MNDFMKYHSESFIEEDVSNSVLECENRDFFGGVNGENVAGIDGKTQVTVFPGISAFIGGDLVADLFNCPDFETKNISLLLDLGTNGEMILGNREKLLAASAAAGPALEGGNIICGTASIPGSICQVKIRNQRAVVKTINNRMPPIGICGTGLISAVSQLKQNHLLEQNGSLRFPYSQTGYPLWTYENGERIALYQQDIREFQMAKAAIRAGIEILMKEFGCKAEDISHVYLAGGFGVHLSEEDAVMTGILPVEFCGKTEFIGNGALKGAVRYGLQTDQTTDVILQRISSLLLAENENFQELFLRYLEI